MISAKRKKWIEKLALIVCLIIGSIWASPKVSADEAEEPVHFVDPALKAAVERQLDIADPTPTDIRSLTFIIADWLGIVDLTGLEHATNLKKLHVAGNDLTDISTLENLTSLEFLYLENNRISDLSPLAQLRNLTCLHLDDNEISDLSALAELDNLVELYISKNKISNISPLRQLSNLQDLRISNNIIVDVHALTGLRNLEVLYLNNNSIVDVSPLSNLKTLQILSFSFNPISNINPLPGLNNLLSLSARRCQIVDISALSNLTNIEHLDFRHNQITNIDVVAGMKNLKSIDIGENEIEDISAITGLARLQSLLLDTNQIVDCNSVVGLTSLTRLWLYSNRISDISAVSRLTNLRSFLAYNNHISDIRPLSSLTNLEDVELRNNQIEEISALSGFSNLIVLDLRNNPLNYEAYHIYIPIIRENNPVVELSYDPIPPEYDQEPFPSHKIFYVDDRAIGKNDGSSWSDAFNHLQDAIRSARYGNEIRVALGVYKPDKGIGMQRGDRHATFQLSKNGVSLKGGYGGVTASDPNERNIDIFKTFLSGDLSGNDIGTIGHESMNENSLHVVSGGPTDSTAILDGFTITGGMANLFPDSFGGGIIILEGAATIRNCTFVHNYAERDGGGLFYRDSVGVIGDIGLTVIDCLFYDNRAGENGGAVSNDSVPSLLIENCIIISNYAGETSGGISCYGLKMVDCVLADNQAERFDEINHWGNKSYHFSVGTIVPELVFDSVTILSNGPDAGTIEDAYFLLEGDLYLTDGRLSIISSLLEGDAKISLDKDAQIRISGYWQYEPVTILRTSILGRGRIEVDASQQLVIEGDAVVNLGSSPERWPDPNNDGRIVVNGSLVVRGNATLENTNVDVKLLEVDDPNSIQYNNITLVEASTGFGGEFFVGENASIKYNNIVSEGDRYLDLDPNPDQRYKPNLTNNRITVIIKEGKLTNQGTLLELRAKDYDVGTAANPLGKSGAYSAIEGSPGFTENPTDNWVLEKLVLEENAKLNLTNRQGFRYQDPNDSFPETVYVKDLVMGPNSVLNTALQTMYYEHLMDPNGTELSRNSDDPEAPLSNGAIFTDIPLLGFSLGIIAMNDQTEFDVRIRKRLTSPEDDHKQPKSPNEPLYIGSIERIESEINPNIPERSDGVMEMRTQAKNKQSAYSVAAKGAFARAGDEDIIIEFEYLFPENTNGDTTLVVYLSDHPEVGHESRIAIAMIQPPEAGRPGSVGSNRFAVFSAVVPRGDLNFCRGTYVELELYGQDAQCWIDNWDPRIYCVAYCGDFNADTEIDPCDYFLLLAEFGLTNPLGANKACLDLVSDGCVGIDDLFLWDAASEIRCLCPREDSETSRTFASSKNSHSSQAVSRGIYLQAEADKELVMFGKRGMGFSRPNGYIYPMSLDGQFGQTTTTSGTGRLVVDRSGQVYQIHHNRGLLCMGNSQKDIIQDNDYEKGVSVGFNESYQKGVPLLDAVFHPDDPNIVYVVPVLAEGTGGTKFKAAAKLKLNPGGVNGSDYSVETVYGLDPADDLNQNIIILSEDIREQLLEPDLQHLKEIEIDSRGEYIYVLSSCWQNGNNWILIYDEDTGELQKCFNLSDPGDSVPDINMPAAMEISFVKNKVYLSSSERSDDMSKDLFVKVYCFSIQQESQDGADSTINLKFDKVIEIQWQAPDESVFERFAGLYEPGRCVSQITSMTEAPDGTLYIVGFTAPMFKEETWKGEPAFFTQPMLTAIEPDTSATTTHVLNNVELPLSVIWK
jgi:internalin A